MFGVGLVNYFSKVTQLESNIAKIPIQGFMTSESLFLATTTMLPPVPMIFTIPN